MEEEKGLRFFRVLLHGFTSKLLLPCDFLKQINGRRREVATLLSPNGKMWDVDCRKETNNKHVFLEGTSWQDFIRANNLREGFFLVFRYKGNMVFSFRAFDLSTREIAYAPAMKNCTKRKKEMMVGDNVEDPDSGDIGESVEAVSSKKRRGSGKEQSEHRVIRTQFELTIEPSNLIRRRFGLKIPEENSTLLGLLKMHLDKIMVEDPTGRKWIVGLRRCGRSLAIYISKGWIDFVHANELKVGDKCIFDLSLQPKQGQLMMKVQIVNKNTLIVNPVQPPKGVNSSRRTNLNFSSFQTTMKAYNLRGNRMYIPLRFVEHNELGECSRLNLKDSKGQTWLVSVTSRSWKGKWRQIYMSEGWLDFARGNKLGLGDVCTFEMVSKEEGNVVQVHVEKLKQL